MATSYDSILDCVTRGHDGPTMVVAALVCLVGIYAAGALVNHALRAKGTVRKRWSLVAVVASGCTAWATHFIVLLAFNPGVPVAFDPILTIASMLCAIVGIGIGVIVAIRHVSPPGKFVAGLIVGLGVLSLHYVGQAAYHVQGVVTWDLGLIAASVLLGLPAAGLSMLCTAGRRSSARWLTPPLLLFSIALMHFCGMAAMGIRFDPRVEPPSHALSPQVITPVVAGVSLALLALAVLGLYFDLAAKARLRWQRERLRALANVTFEGLLICQNDLIVMANASAERFSGHGTGTLSGSSLRSLLPELDVAAIPECEEFETELVAAGGGRVPVRVLRRDVLLERTPQTVIAIRDQRERIKLHALAFRDPLTGLANRRRFLDLLTSGLASPQACDPSFAVLMLDLDGFKPVNDRFGHAAGDRVLVEVGARLVATLRATDVVARLGGDEFAILSRGGDGSDTPEALAARIVRAIQSHVFVVEEYTVAIGISVGIAVAPGDGTDPDKLIRHADAALYAAKGAGRGCYRRSEPSGGQVRKAVLEPELAA